MATRNALNKAQQQSTRANTRSRRPVLISSHPEADPELPVPAETAHDIPADDAFRRGPDAERPKPIVSINGNDVEETDESECDAA